MTHLRIENQNSNVEIVNAAIIQKLYNLVLDIEENLEEGESLSDYVSLKGNLQADHAKQSAYNYLTGNLSDTNTKRFPNLTINLTDGAYIDFADPEVERVLLANNIGDGVGVSTIDAADTAIGNIFASNTTVQSFDEFDRFTASQSGNFSFNGCTNLTSINLSNVTAITTNYCFGKTAIETLHVPLLISFTAQNPFNCWENSPQTNLKHVTSLGNITTLGKNGNNSLYTFQYQKGLLDVNLPSTCTELGSGVFKGCIKLATINLNNVQKINGEAFECWSGSGKTVLSNVDSSQDLTNITSVGAFGFRGTRLGVTGGALNLPALTGSIGQWAFAACPITSITSLGNATSIGDKGFYQCLSLATVSGISNVTSIGVDAFKECTALTSIDLSNVTTLSNSCFEGCTSLASIDLSNVTSIGGACFNNCRSLGVGQDLDINLDNVSVGGSNTFKGVGYRSITLHETTEHSISNFPGSGQYDTFGAGCANLIKFDLSDTKQTGSTGSLYSDTMTTLIYPETQISLVLKGRDYGKGLLYIICLSRQLSDISTSTHWEWVNNLAACAIYVWDDIFDTYIQMPGWQVQYNAGRVKKISQLPSDITWYTKEHPTT